MTETQAYVAATDANFDSEVLQHQGPVLVDFWASWCGPCIAIAPTIEQIASEYAGRLKVAKVNVDENPGAAVRFGIRSIPTLLWFQNGEVVDQSVGAAPLEALRRKADSMVAES